MNQAPKEMFNESLNLQDLKAEFDANGFVVVRGFFKPQDMAGLISTIKTGKTRNGVSGLNKGAMTFYSSLFFHNPEIREFVSQPRIVELLAPLLGPDFWVRWDQAVAKGPGADVFGWHQDNGYSRLYDPYVQLWVALTDMTPENGGLWIKPGSHLQWLPHINRSNHRVIEKAPENPVFIEAKAGDVVIFSSLALHSTTPNVTETPRWAYVIEYMASRYFDPSIEPPYLIVSRDGKPCSEFVESYEGSRNLWNRLKYLGFNRGLRWNWLKTLPARLNQGTTSQSTTT